MRLTALAVAVFAAILGIGCGGPAVTVRYEPAGSPRSRLPGGLPKLYIADVTDRTSVRQLQGPKGVFVQDPGVRWAEVAREALSAELGRLGWPLTQTPSLAAAHLSAEVLADASWGAGFNVRVNGKVRMQLALEDATGRAVWDGVLDGTGLGVAGGGGVPANGIRMAWRAALEQAMTSLGPLLSTQQPWKLLDGAPALARPAVGAAPVPVAPAVRTDVDELPAQRGARKAHAVVIGIERYRETLPVADFAAGDARLAAEYLKRLGVPEENVALLTDERATKSDFEKYFERWLPNRVEAGDEVYVYFSGHGAPNPAKGDAYLVPYDGDPTYIEQTGYPLAKLYAQLSKLPAKRVLVAMDSCFSGAGGRSVIAKGARPLVSLVAADVPGNVTVLSASAGDQISNSYQEKGHGLFTYFLLKGMKEKGADFKAVFEYLKPEVARVARREYNADQEPQMREGK